MLRYLRLLHRGSLLHLQSLQSALKEAELCELNAKGIDVYSVVQFESTDFHQSYIYERKQCENFHIATKLLRSKTTTCTESQKNITWLSRTFVLSITSTSTFSSVTGWYLFTPTIVSKKTAT